MRSFACLLADDVLADAILSSPIPLLPPTNIRKGFGGLKKVRKLNPEKTFTNK